MVVRTPVAAKWRAIKGNGARGRENKINQKGDLERQW